jgi:hypothetical protein
VAVALAAGCGSDGGDEPLIEQFLRVGRFLHSGMAFSTDERAVWIARAAPASGVRVDLGAGVE